MKGFTLLEVIVVVSIMLVVTFAGIFLVNRNVNSAYEARAKEVLSQVYTLMQAYYDQKGNYPTGTLANVLNTIKIGPDEQNYLLSFNQNVNYLSDGTYYVLSLKISSQPLGFDRIITLTDRGFVTGSTGLIIVGPSQVVKGTTVQYKAIPLFGTNNYQSFTWTVPTTNTVYSSLTSQILKTSFNQVGTANISCTVKDSNNNTLTSSLTVAIQDSITSLSVSINGPSNVYGSSSSSNKFVAWYAAQVSGGTPPYTYQWSNGSTIYASTYTWYSPGTYTVSVKVTDANNQQVEKSMQVVCINKPYSASISGPSKGVVNKPYTYTVGVNGGTPPYTYKWNNGETSISSVYTWTAPGSYLITCDITDANGIKISATYSVDIYPALAVAIAGPTTAVYNTTVLYKGIVTGGTGNYTYSWTIQDGNPQYSADQIVYTKFISTGTKKITLQVQDDMQQATAELNVQVVQSDLTVTISGPTQLEKNKEYTYTVSVQNGSGLYQYSWKDAIWISSDNTQAKYKFSNVGTYVIQCVVKDLNTGKQATGSLQVVVSDSVLQVVIMGPPSVSAGSVASYRAVVTGGTSPYTYQWGKDYLINSSLDTASYKWNTVGIYYVEVTVTDSQGIQKTQKISVNVSSSLVVSIEGPTEGEIGEQLKYAATVTGGSGAYSYTWSTDSLIDSNASLATYQFDIPGTYTIKCTVTDLASFAQNSAMITVNIYPKLTIYISGNKYLLVNTLGTYMAGITGGKPPYTITWSTNGLVSGQGSNNATYKWSATGKYTITLDVKDARNKEVTVQKEITVYTPLTVTIIGPTEVEQGSAYTYTGIPSGGIPYEGNKYKIQFSTGHYDIAQQLSFTYMWGVVTYPNSPPISLVCTVTDAAGNTATATISIIVYKALNITSLTMSAEYSFMTNIITATIEGGKPPYTYSFTYYYYSYGVPGVVQIQKQFTTSDTVVQWQTISSATAAIDIPSKLSYSMPSIVYLQVSDSLGQQQQYNYSKSFHALASMSFSVYTQAPAYGPGYTLYMLASPTINSYNTLKLMIGYVSNYTPLRVLVSVPSSVTFLYNIVNWNSYVPDSSSLEIDLYLLTNAPTQGKITIKVADYRCYDVTDPWNSSTCYYGRIPSYYGSVNLSYTGVFVNPPTITDIIPVFPDHYTQKNLPMPGSSFSMWNYWNYFMVYFSGGAPNYSLLVNGSSYYFIAASPYTVNLLIPEYSSTFVVSAQVKDAIGLTSNQFTKTFSTSPVVVYISRYIVENTDIEVEESSFKSSTLSKGVYYIFYAGYYYLVSGTDISAISYSWSVIPSTGVQIQNGNSYNPTIYWSSTGTYTIRCVLTYNYKGQQYQAVAEWTTTVN
ncbi:MAG: prepilin-type N-terminal cleavage/methylation domain-containing protein [Conexivisphaerales archaeon]